MGGGHAAAYRPHPGARTLNTLALGPSWLDPDYLIGQFGLAGVLVIVFAESGLLIGFFLPGDSLLFTTGLLVTTDKLHTPLWLVCVLVALAAIIGDQVGGYLFGRKVGPLALQPARLAPLQAGERREGPRVLREARPEVADPGPLRAHRAHLHPRSSPGGSAG